MKKNILVSLSGLGVIAVGALGVTMLFHAKLGSSSPVPSATSTVASLVQQAGPIPGDFSVSGPLQLIGNPLIKRDGLFFSWNPFGTLVAGYHVYRNGRLITTATTTSFTEQPILLPQTTYTYDVVPVSQSGDEESPKGTLTFTTMPEPTIPKSGTLKILAIPLVFKGEEYLVSDTPEHIDAMLFGSKDSAKIFYSNASFGKLQIFGTTTEPMTVTPWIEGNNFNDYAGSTDFFERLNEEYVRQNPGLGDWLSSYDIIVYVTPHLTEGADGAAVGGNGDADSFVSNGIIAINGTRGFHTYAHEIGHVLGLDHARLDNCADFDSSVVTGCELGVNGDVNDIMGEARNNEAYDFGFYSLDSRRKALLKWLPSKAVSDTTQSGMYPIGADEIESTVATSITADPAFTVYFDNHLPFEGKSGSVAPGIRIKFVFPGQISSNSRPGQQPTFVSYKLQVPQAVLESQQTFVLHDGDAYELPKSNEIKGTTWRIIQLSHDDNAAQSFVRFDPTYNLKVTAGAATDAGCAAVLTWDKVPLLGDPKGSDLGGYEIYRDGTLIATLTAKDAGDAPTYTDPAAGEQSASYTVRAYDEFQSVDTLLGAEKKYEMLVSDPVSSSGCSKPVTPPPASPDPSSLECPPKQPINCSQGKDSSDNHFGGCPVEPKCVPPAGLSWQAANDYCTTVFLPQVVMPIVKQECQINYDSLEAYLKAQVSCTNKQQIQIAQDNLNKDTQLCASFTKKNNQAAMKSYCGQYMQEDAIALQKAGHQAFVPDENQCLKIGTGQAN